jgi:hypothetical protein
LLLLRVALEVGFLLGYVGLPKAKLIFYFNRTDTLLLFFILHLSILKVYNSILSDQNKDYSYLKNT